MKKIIKILLFPFYLIKKSLSLLRIQYYKLNSISIGENTFISPKAYIDHHKGSNVIIGSNCYITRNVVILNHTDTCRGGPKGIWLEKGGGRISKDVIIGNNVFIGVNSVVLSGVTIGDNVVVGALSLVNKDLPADTVWAGVPVRYISETSQMIEKELPNFMND